MMRVIYQNRCLALWSGLMLLGLAWPAMAHNGAVAIAVPVERIKVDGDLSDWPEDVSRYPIALPEFGDRPVSERDFRGDFRLGYDARENLLYIAMEVTDESKSITTTATWVQDGCEVYVDVDHKGSNSPVVQLAKYGDFPVSGPGVSIGQAREEIQAEMRWNESGRLYEWRIDLDLLSREQGRAQPGTVLGIDVVVNDLDADGSFSWMAWGRSPFKITSEDRRGDVVLLGEDMATGGLQGRVKWADGGEGVGRSRVRIQAAQREDGWVQVETDRDGRFTLEMPVGAYNLNTEIGREGSSVVNGEVEQGDTSQVEWAVPAPQGSVVQAGRGRTVQAGAGFRQGLWQTFDIADGLSSSEVISIIQDSEGYLWFGTGGGGVCRYDGTQFVIFTTEDGLASDVVSAIVEDREGNLWFGTDAGVSRYDGEQFVTFTIQDGLVDNVVSAIVEDREGNLWFGTGAGVSRYDGRHFTAFTTADGLGGGAVRAIGLDQQGHLWFATWGGGIYRYDGQSWSNFRKPGRVNAYLFSLQIDREGSIWSGWYYEGASQYDGEKFVTFTEKDGLANNRVLAILEDGEGQLWMGTGAGVSRYDDKGFLTFTTKDGLADNYVQAICEDREHHLWFGTPNGVSRYDGKLFAHFTTADGLPHNNVSTMREDSRGRLWLGTVGGMGRYDGQRWISLASEDTLASRAVRAIGEDGKGHLWFGTMEGVLHYDGKHFTAFSGEGGRLDTHVPCIALDRAGNLWFGTGTWQGPSRLLGMKRGVHRYDGKTLATFTSADGLVSEIISSILGDRQGRMWFGTDKGVSRYDEKNWTTFTTADGLAGNVVLAMMEDREGRVWFGTDKGVSRYDGESWSSFSAKEGLLDNVVSSIVEDREGLVWLGTGSGVSLYNGRVFQGLSQRDGLVHNVVQNILQDRYGDIWVATIGGLTRYRRQRTPPAIHLRDVVTDRHHGLVDEVRLSAAQRYIAFEFHGISFKTRPGQMVYLYRLEGYDEDWLQTRATRVEYTDLSAGDYVFAVRAVDRDLNYSEEAATVRVILHPPYGQIVLVGSLGIMLVGLVIATGYAVRRRQERDRARERLIQALEKELQTAHDLQMGLMPKEPPRIAGFEITGRCIPANHVGGDLFQYFQQDRKLSISLADVTGHAMEAAIPVVMFSGILKSQMEMGGSVEELFRRLNRSLHGTLTSHTFVCLAMGELDPASRLFRFSNSGCPYPYHYRAVTGEVVELRVDAYPLGVRPDTTYQAAEAQLEPGDRVVFCSDGIIEAANRVGQMFGFERTAETIRLGCAEDLSAGDLLARIIQEVKAFSGEVPQGDDQTVVVLKVER